MFPDDFVPITPVNFFQVGADCRHLGDKTSFPFLTGHNYRKFLLPDASALCGETAFAEVAIGWSTAGLEFYVKVDQPFSRASFPEIQKGDAVEIFVDTRDVKTSGFNTRFCHHFYFLPESLDGNQKGEITRFRTEDIHPLCDPNELQVKGVLKPSQYTLHAFIPSHCLHGYDPEQFDRLGFSYRINRVHGFPQHFSVVSEDYQIEQQPSLWGSLRLLK